MGVNLLNDETSRRVRAANVGIVGVEDRRWRLIECCGDGGRRRVEQVVVLLVMLLVERMVGPMAGQSLSRRVVVMVLVGVAVKRRRVWVICNRASSGTTKSIGSSYYGGGCA